MFCSRNEVMLIRNLPIIVGQGRELSVCMSEVRAVVPDCFPSVREGRLAGTIETARLSLWVYRQVVRSRPSKESRETREQPINSCACATAVLTSTVHALHEQRESRMGVQR
jgi:hypothetical protein